MACGTERKRDRAPYDIWEQQGFIRAIPGASIDYETVAKDIADILSDCDVKALAFDRWRFDLLKKEMDEIGLESAIAAVWAGI
jgi:phage terminase large subunit-like protein